MHQHGCFRSGQVGDAGFEDRLFVVAERPRGALGCPRSIFTLV
jgi:hypothetical protein